MTLTVFCFGCGKSGGESGGIEWGADMDAALKEAKETDRIVMVDFMATWCPPCRAMEDSTFCRPEVIEKAKMFVTVRIDVDEQKDGAVKYGGNARKYGGIGIPNILFMTSGEEKIKHIVGYHGPDNLIMVMDSVLARSTADEE
ncbi:MAG TPA: thioredoxin family protein [Candidatus Krumholzibacterium sp.]|nr:thioredoxin family protein [Candidatus Krumholzibacterium sp.]